MKNKKDKKELIKIIEHFIAILAGIATITGVTIFGPVKIFNPTESSSTVYNDETTGFTETQISDETIPYEPFNDSSELETSENMPQQTETTVEESSPYGDGWEITGYGIGVMPPDDTDDKKYEIMGHEFINNGIYDQLNYKWRVWEKY